MGDISNEPITGSLLIVTWDLDISKTLESIRSRFRKLVVTQFDLKKASQQLLDEASDGVWPARYVFNQLLNSTRDDFDDQTVRSSNLLKRLLHDATIYTTSASYPSERLMMPNVKLIHLLSAGIEAIVNTPFYQDTSIDITNIKGVQGIAIGEWVIMAVLSFRKNRLLINNLQQNHDWGSSTGSITPFATGLDLHGCKVGILGYGSIGRQVARLFTAFGCTILAYTASPRPTPESRKDKGSYIIPGTGDPEGIFPSAWFSGHSKESLHAFLSQGLDYLILTIPLTPATKHIISSPELDILSQNPGVKDKCYMINIARGGIVDQDALISALNEGKLSGAASDVASPEPLPSDSGFWDAKNVMLSPHVSSLGKELYSRAFDVLITNLERMEEGEELLNRVVRGKGYEVFIWEGEKERVVKLSRKNDGCM